MNLWSNSNKILKRITDKITKVWPRQILREIPENTSGIISGKLLVDIIEGIVKKKPEGISEENSRTNPSCKLKTYTGRIPEKKSRD